MQDSLIKCIRVSDEQRCRICFSTVCVKNGRTKTGKQQYRCKDCGSRFIAFYSYTAYSTGIDNQIIQFIKEGLGIRSFARILKISTTTQLAVVYPSLHALHTLLGEVRCWAKSPDFVLVEFGLLTDSESERQIG